MGRRSQVYPYVEGQEFTENEILKIPKKKVVLIKDHRILAGMEPRAWNWP